jgi:hypothetical protein
MPVEISVNLAYTHCLPAKIGIDFILIFVGDSWSRSFLDHWAGSDSGDERGTHSLSRIEKLLQQGTVAPVADVEPGNHAVELLDPLPDVRGD